MDIIKGKIVTNTEKPASEPEKAIEYFTDPVPVRRYKSGIGTVIIVQTALSLILGGILWWAAVRGGEIGAFADEIIRRFLYG